MQDELKKIETEILFRQKRKTYMARAFLTSSIVLAASMVMSGTGYFITAAIVLGVGVLQYPKRKTAALKGYSPRGGKFKFGDFIVHRRISRDADDLASFNKKKFTLENKNGFLTKK